MHYLLAKIVISNRDIWKSLNLENLSVRSLSFKDNDFLSDFSKYNTEHVLLKQHKVVTTVVKVLYMGKYITWENKIKINQI